MELTLSGLDHAVDQAVEAAIKRHLPVPAPAPPNPWLSRREAAKYIGVSPATLQRYQADGLIPFSKIGGRVWYRRDDLDAALDSHRVSA